MPSQISLSPDRYFDPNPAQKKIAQQLYKSIANLPLICPHGHVDPALFSAEDYQFGTPTELLIIPDHYVFRMLYAQGIPLEALGVSRQDGGEVEQDHRQIWQTFAEHFHLFCGTPTGIWLNDELYTLFGVRKKLTSETAQEIYEQISRQLAKPDFQPRSLYKQFNIEVLCTTDAATDTLEHHQTIRDSSWGGRILPTFRPDKVVQIDTPNWREQIEELGKVTGIDVHNYTKFIEALENRRAFFKEMGAVATDHAAFTPYTESLSPQEAESIFQRALQGVATAEDAARFNGNMLIEMARMSAEDGLVMQLHVGSFRNHNQPLFKQFGPDTGSDIPVSVGYTRNLKPLLNKFGSHPRLTLILFTLDESNYSRELAPLAGHYPILRLGPPWWFHDSLNGIRRYFDQVIETAGIYNTAGFNDDTRAYPSIPARHDVWRRASTNWLAGLAARNIIDEEDAAEMAYQMAYGLAKKTYRL